MGILYPKLSDLHYEVEVRRSDRKVVFSKYVDTAKEIYEIANNILIEYGIRDYENQIKRGTDKDGFTYHLFIRVYNEAINEYEWRDIHHYIIEPDLMGQIQNFSCNASYMTDEMDITNTISLPKKLKKFVAKITMVLYHERCGSDRRSYNVLLTNGTEKNVRSVSDIRLFIQRQVE